MTITFHSQDRSTYCGPSCAQYILGELGVVRTQETLFRHIRKFKSRDRGKNRLKWSSSPDGLTYVLNWYRNKFQPPNQKCEFELFPFGGKKGVAGKMKSAIVKFKIPCISQIYDDNHWVVIDGYQPPATNKPEGFSVNDPTQDQQLFINYLIWVNKLAFPVTGGRWIGKFLAICDPVRNNRKAKKENPSKMPTSFIRKVKPGKFIGNETPNQSGPLILASNTGITIIPKPKPVLLFIKDPVGGKVNLIDEPTASAYTEWWLSAGGFYNPEKFRLFIPTLRAGSPLLVQELVGKQDFYYLVPLLGENNKIYAIMNIAAGNADFSEFTSSTDTKNSFAFTPLTDDQITRMVKKKYPSANVKTGISIHKTLVWKFCRQSQTEFQPFYMVTIGKRTLFIRFDKKIFTRLS
jgi:hypothetical protein